MLRLSGRDCPRNLQPASGLAGIDIVEATLAANLDLTFLST